MNKVVFKSEMRGRMNGTPFTYSLHTQHSLQLIYYSTLTWGDIGQGGRLLRECLR